MTIKQSENVVALPARSIALVLHVTDSDTIAALEQCPSDTDRDAFALQAMRIGVLALRGASGVIDADVVRREHERMESALRELMTQRGRELGDALNETLAAFLDPDSGSLRTQILREFSLDHEGSALARLVSALLTHNESLRKELAHDLMHARLADEQKDVALQERMVAMLNTFAEENRKFHVDVRAALSAKEARREIVARTPEHGRLFEDAVGDILARYAQQRGDIHDAVGTLDGHLARKVGDHVYVLGPDSVAAGMRLVFEAKGRVRFSDKDAIDELVLARRNRDARVGIFVRERACVAEGTLPFRRIGRDILIVWDANDPVTDVYLDAALSVATALCATEHEVSEKPGIDVREIDAAIHGIANLAVVIDGLSKAAHVINSKSEQMVAVADRARGVLQRQLAILRKQVNALH